jgi:hypothetical protein
MIDQMFIVLPKAVERLFPQPLFLDNINKKKQKIFIHRTLVVIAIM